MRVSTTAQSVAIPSALSSEIEYRNRLGMRCLPLRAMEAEFHKLGYRFDRGMDCFGVARYMTGERAGESYPSCSLYVRQVDDGMSAMHFEARRDAAHQRMQELRSQLYAVVRGVIYEA